MSASKWFIALCVLVPLVEIIVLEVLQRKSDAQDGIGDLRLSLHVSQNMMVTVPAVVMLCTAALFSATEWAIGVIAPFSLARKQPIPLRHLDRTSAEGLAPVVIAQAISKRQYTLSIITATTLLGSFLTIMASGLFSLNSIPGSVDVTVTTKTQFNTSAVRGKDDNAATAFDLVQLHHASYPAGTSTDFAFPLMQINESSDSIRNALQTATFIDIDVSVLRGHLNCSTVPEKNMQYDIGTAYTAGYNQSVTMAVLNVTMDLPRACQYSSRRYRNASQMFVSYSIEDPDFSSGAIVVAELEEIWAWNSNGNYSEQAWPDYCPSLAFIVGSFDNDTSVDNKTVLVCTQLQQEISATLRFDLPSFSLSADPVLQLDEGRAKTVSGDQYLFDYLLQAGLNKIAQDLPSAPDSFYGALLNGTDKPIGSMLGSQNEAFFYKQTEKLYRNYMAQVIGHAMRVNDPNTSTIDWTLPTLPLRTQLHGLLQGQDHMRVFQNKEPKIALQALLAAMIVGVIAAYATVDIKKTLPHNPSSIAGTLSFLVGSDFAEECATIADLCDDDEEPERRLQDREVRLGWWYHNRGENMYSDVSSSPRFGLDFVDS